MNKLRNRKKNMNRGHTVLIHSRFLFLWRLCLSAGFLSSCLILDLLDYLCIWLSCSHVGTNWLMMLFLKTCSKLQYLSISRNEYQIIVVVKSWWQYVDIRITMEVNAVGPCGRVWVVNVLMKIDVWCMELSVPKKSGREI